MIENFSELINKNIFSNFDVAFQLLQKKYPHIDISTELKNQVDKYMEGHNIDKQSITLWNRQYFRQEHHKTQPESRKKKISTGINKKFQELKLRSYTVSQNITSYLDENVSKELYKPVVNYVIAYTEKNYNKDNHFLPKEIEHLLVIIVKWQEIILGEIHRYFKSQVRKNLKFWLTSGKMPEWIEEPPVIENVEVVEEKK